MNTLTQATMQVTQNMENEHNWTERIEGTLEYSQKWKN